jgi:hypothetical protein
MEIRAFFALPDLRELSLGNPQGLLARSRSVTTDVKIHPTDESKPTLESAYSLWIYKFKPLSEPF